MITLSLEHGVLRRKLRLHVMMLPQAVVGFFGGEGGNFGNFSGGGGNGGGYHSDWQYGRGYRESRNHGLPPQKKKSDMQVTADLLFRERAMMMIFSFLYIVFCKRAKRLSVFEQILPRAGGGNFFSYMAFRERARRFFC